MLPVLLYACTPGAVVLDRIPYPDSGDTAAVGEVSVTDEAPTSGYIDDFFGSWQRGRGNVVLDVDGDGDNDVFTGNPGNTSYLIMNETPMGGPLAFSPGQVLAVDEVLWTGAAADYDNDGDADLFVGLGGNEDRAFDRLYQNTGAPMNPLQDITPLIGLGARLPDGTPLPTGTAGVIWFDVDNDGWLDVFASGHLQLSYLDEASQANGLGLNQLYRALGDGTFEEIAWRAGLRSQVSTRNSTVLDYDRDGDLDIFENNFVGANTLWRNEWVETGTVTFTDVTAAQSLGGADLSWPRRQDSMCAIAADLDNDGWQDIVIFRRGPKDDADEPAAHDVGHLLWMNQQGTGFVEVASYTDLNASFGLRDHEKGVMGCQVGDLDADGFPDVFVGNGGPDNGERNNLFISSHRTEVEVPGVGTVVAPFFEDWSARIDFAPEGTSASDPAPYPYRTHGSSMGDLDGDGLLELLVHNGGPSTTGTDAEMQEPNRLFKFTFPERPHHLQVHLVGGLGVNRDGIGARVRVTVTRSSDGASWDLYQVRSAGSGFGACNQADLLFGLGDGDGVSLVRVEWPDGTVTESVPLEIDTRMVILR